MAIKKLDPLTIEQIAAGEVIESPLSVVKELVENSLDAGAKNIVVEIKNGGKSYIRVTDDGCGIANDDFILAFDKHTTSKISDFSDLYNIYSLGFRGEALASIQTVSDVVAVSKTNESQIGKKLTFKNGKVSESIIATNTGTSIEVMDLFKNIPVRKKFLRSDISETNSISKLMYSLALGYDNISFKYIKDNRIEFKTNTSDSLKVKIINLLDDNLEDMLIIIDNSNDLYTIKGYITNPNYYRASRLFEYTYVNNRLIESDLVRKSIESQYKSFLPNGRFPAFFIFIETNPKNLDVNVHPNKKNIKFNYEDELEELIKDTIKKSLTNNKAIKEINFKEEKSNDLPDLSKYKNLLEDYKGFNIVREDKEAYEDDSFFDNNRPIKVNKTNDFKKESVKADTNDGIKNSFLEKPQSYLYLTSLFGKYSVFKESDDNIIILNHRRADEAIKFDSFMKEKDFDNIASQMLLEPIIINLKADDKAKYDMKREKIIKLGFDIEEFGDNQIIIRSLPQIFEGNLDDRFFYELIDVDFNKKSDLFLKDLYKLIKNNSFRKGHKIDKDEATYLLERLNQLENPYRTYDGKTIMIKISEDEMEKFFDR